jgi:hypothetical protein
LAQRKQACGITHQIIAEPTNVVLLFHYLSHDCVLRVSQIVVVA